MNLVALDASTRNLSICLIRKNKIIIQFDHRGKFLSSKIISILEKQLKSSGFKLKCLDAIVIGIGPGSFTGLRVSLAITKALSLSLNKPIIPVPSFKAVISQISSKHKKVAIIADARKNLIYAATYQFKDNAFRQEGKEMLAVLSEFIQGHKDYYFITIDNHLKQEALIINPDLLSAAKEIYPKAGYLVDFKKLPKSVRADKLEPLYLHQQDCQVKNPR